MLKSWIFSSSDRGDRRIVVNDEVSAESVRALLKAAGQDRKWSEEVLDSPAPPGEAQVNYSHFPGQAPMANPYLGHPFMGNPYMAHPYMHNPYMGHPFVPQAPVAPPQAPVQHQAPVEPPQAPVQHQAPVQAQAPVQHQVPVQPPAPAERGERRAHRRYEAEFRVVLIAGSHSFRNTTMDVSIGGLRLSKPLPKVFLGRICTIFISHSAQYENAQVHCRVIPDEDDLMRIQFVDTDPSEISRLEAWLKGSDGKNSAA